MEISKLNAVEALGDAERPQSVSGLTRARVTQSAGTDSKCRPDPSHVSRCEHGSTRPAAADDKRQLAHMARVLDDLLDVSRISNGDVELRKEAIDVAQAMQVGVEASQPLIDSMGHQLSVSFPPYSVMLDADPIRLAQIVSILLNNAALYSTPGGRIHLRVDCAGPELRLSVKDSGVGIRPEDLDKIFEPFVQLGPPSARRQGGLGVGLSLVRTMVALHGGRVEACSAGPGGGSEFIVRLPVLVERAKGEPLSRAEQAVPPESAGGVTHHVDTSRHREVVLIGPGICAPHTTNVSIPRSTPSGFGVRGATWN